MFEIRIPTYKRPHLLKRALSSVIAQTMGDWRAIVLEDSPQNESVDVVNHFNDDRIEFRKCSRNRGVAGNLSYAFSPEPFCKGARYACVLEDDNYYQPRFLANATERLEESNLDVFCGNAQVAQLFENGTQIIQERYTMSQIYGHSIREIDIKERLRAFLSGGCVIGNLCLVWKLGKSIDLSVSGEQFSQIAQERLRAISWIEPMIFDPEPNAIWTNFADKETLDKTRSHNRRWRRSQILMNTKWVSVMKKCKFEAREEEMATVQALCLDSLSYSAIKSISSPEDVLRIVRNLFLFLFY
jgi:glycosyltransferase involved in cell wall biosynthesis